MKSQANNSIFLLDETESGVINSEGENQVKDHKNCHDKALQVWIYIPFTCFFNSTFCLFIPTGVFIYVDPSANPLWDYSVTHFMADIYGDDDFSSVSYR